MAAGCWVPAFDHVLFIMSAKAECEIAYDDASRLRTLYGEMANGTVNRLGGCLRLDVFVSRRDSVVGADSE